MEFLRHERVFLERLKEDWYSCHTSPKREIENGACCRLDLEWTGKSLVRRVALLRDMDILFKGFKVEWGKKEENIIKVVECLTLKPNKIHVNLQK